MKINDPKLFRLLTKEEVHRKGLDADAAKLSAKSVYPTELYRRSIRSWWRGFWSLIFQCALRRGGCSA